MARMDRSGVDLGGGFSPEGFPLSPQRQKESFSLHARHGTEAVQAPVTGKLERKNRSTGYTAGRLGIGSLGGRKGRKGRKRS